MLKDDCKNVYGKGLILQGKISKEPCENKTESGLEINVNFGIENNLINTLKIVLNS